MVSEKRWQTAWMRSKNNPFDFVGAARGIRTPDPIITKKNCGRGVGYNRLE
jgi:hypothetical protein